MNLPGADAVETYLRELQQRITDAFAQRDTFAIADVAHVPLTRMPDDKSTVAPPPPQFVTFASEHVEEPYAVHATSALSEPPASTLSLAHKELVSGWVSSSLPQKTLHAPPPVGHATFASAPMSRNEPLPPSWNTAVSEDAARPSMSAQPHT